MTDFVFIDSGVGVIPYMTSLLQKPPDASCVYVADNANFPYGEKTHDEVVNCVVSVVQKICDKFEPRVIVLACNTISVNALEAVRQKFSQVELVAINPIRFFLETEAASLIAGTVPTNLICENFCRTVSRAFTEIVLQARTITRGLNLSQIF